MPAVDITPSLSIYYLDLNPEGSPIVLLLHGLGATGDSWRLQFDPLTSAGFRVLAPDMRGFGRSSCPKPCRSIKEMAADILLLLKELGLGHVNLAGISMGGTVALQIAVERPDLVDRLVLVNTFSKLSPPSLSGWFYFAYRFFLVHTLGLSAQAQAVARRIFPHPEQSYLRQNLYEQVIQADPRGYRSAMRALARFNIHHRLPEIASPTLVITGECDSTVPPGLQQSMAESIPDARQVLIRGGGHAVSVDQPEAFNKVLLDFLK
jgi:3-oxoadipate enol-lactonase